MLLFGVSRAAEEPVTCATCHAEEARDFSESIHRQFSCLDCHMDEAAAEPIADERRYVRTESAAGTTLTFDHGPAFTGKPSRVDVPRRCGSCHADVERMNPYGLRTDQLARYWTSGHGKALAATGDERVAVCTDCHGWHKILSGRELASKTHPLNVPGTCALCHADPELMAKYDLPVQVVEEYRLSVHGRLLFEQQDTGAPTCATCHGNHSAMPPGFATVGAVCGRCHERAAETFATSIHAEQEEHRGCVQCHGAGEGRHFHLIERITRPTGILIRRYARLLATVPSPTAEQIHETIHPGPKQIIMRALPTCLECHEELEEDESLPKLFELLDAIAEAEQEYVKVGQRLEEFAQGVLLVDRQRFLFEDAKTFLIELAPLQHTLNNEKVAEKVAQLNAVCKQVSEELDELEGGLRMRHVALVPIWIFSVLFAALCYAKYRQLKSVWVTPLPAKNKGTGNA